MSGASENATRSADSPAATARLCSPDAPYDCEKLTPCPAGVFWNAEISWPYASFGVEYATSASFVSRAAPAASAGNTSATSKARLIRLIGLSLLVQ